MNGRRWFLLAAMLLWATAAYSVEAVVSYAVFHKPGDSRGRDSAFIEVYWQINPSSLHYHKNDKGELYAQIQTAVGLTLDTVPVNRDRYVLQTTPAKPGVAAQQHIMQLRRYYAPPGTIHLRLDLGETEFPEQNFRFQTEVNTLDTITRAHYAGIQLLDTFIAGSMPGPFLKGGYQQVPRVLNFYDEGQRLVHFYAESYNGKHTGEKLIRHFYITRRAGDYPVARLQLYDTMTDAAAIHSGRYTLSIATLPTGNYFLNAHLLDSKGTILDTQSVFFQMVNAKPEEIKITSKDSANAAKAASTFLDLSNTFVSKFTVKQIMAILKMISPLADPAEANAINNFMKRPDEMYMRYFVYNYFSKTNKAHPEAAWKDFSDLIREVNRDFNAGGKMGYETDRGRVYLQYGQPDERVRVPNEAGAVPYEIWRYNAVGNTGQLGTFLFYQPGFAIGDYKLLTSTVTGELNNPAWKSVLYSTGRSSGNGNSRAEQYLEGK